MAFNPDVIRNHVYKTPEGKRYIVKDHNNNEAVVVRINNENLEESGEMTWNETQWNSKHLIDESKGDGIPPVDDDDDDDYMEEPDAQEYMFVYNSSDKKLYVKNRQGNVVTQFDVMSADGLDAYQLWKSKQKKGADTTWDAFLKVFQGKDGNDGNDGEEGKSAYEIWKKVTNPNEGQDREIDFLNSLKGQDGHDAKDGKSAYDIWKETTNPPKGKDRPVDFLNFLKGNDGHDAVDGLSAYELWKEAIKPEPGADSITDFFNYLRGKDGVDGKDAYALWIELGGKGDKQEFLKWLASKVETQKGENGTTYVPHIEKGELFFVNDITGDKTIPQPILGKDGKTYYPHIDGYELYYTEDKEGNGPEVLPRVNLRGKQGRTFTPKFDGTKLHFEDGEGEETKAVELRGKNAYELWVEDGHPGATYEDFKKFFAGRVVNKKYGYKDIKDWTAPVQHINRHLLTDSDTIDAGLNAEQYYLYRQEQIEEIREEGRAKRGNWFQEVFWWCSGADTSVLRTCPGDYSKYVGIGTVIFFTALMAFFSSFTAMQLVFNSVPGKDNFDIGWIASIVTIFAGVVFFIHYGFRKEITTEYSKTKKKNFVSKVEYNKIAWAVAVVIIIIGVILGVIGIHKTSTTNGIAIIFALFWASMIFFLDRFITNTMYSDGKTTISWLEFRSSLPRILISIFLGIVISAPLELQIFEQEIDEYIRQDKFAKIESDVLDNQEYKDTLAVFNDIKQKQKDAYSTWQGIQQKDYRKNIDIKNTVSTGTTVSTKADGTTFDKPTYTTTTTSKEVDDVARYNEEKNNAWNKYIELSGKLDDYENVKRNTFNRLKDETKMRYNDTDSVGLYERLMAMHGVAMKEGKEDGYKEFGIPEWGQIIIGLVFFFFVLLFFVFNYLSNNKEINTEIDKLSYRKTRTKDDNILESIDASISELKSSIKKNKYSLLCVRIPIAVILGVLIGWYVESLHYLVFYLTTPIGLIMLLFILIDVSPVFYKMMLADGRYDKILHQDKLIEQDLIRVRVAKTLQKVNESELSSLSPFIFGHTFDKIKRILAEKVNKEKKAVELYDPNDEESVIIKNKNKELFEKVLGMKYRIAYASYAAWYKNMYDLNLGYEEIDEEHVDSPEEIKDKFVVMFRSSPEVGGNVSVKNEKDAYSPNSVVEVNAVANEGFEFIGWRDDESAPSKRDITISEDKIYVALFRRTKETE